MSFVVRRIVKLAGSSIGLGHEAYLHHKEKTAAAASPYDNTREQELPETDAQGLPPQRRLDQVVDCREQDLDHDNNFENENKNENEDEDEDDGNDTSDLSVDVQDDWRLDEEAGLPPPYESLNSAGSAEKNADDDGDGSTPPRDGQASARSPDKNQGKSLIAAILDSAGPVPTSTTTREPLLLPVVLPQRRPGTKARGFIRAYAPDLARGGISQETFLRFLDGFDAAVMASPYLQAVYMSATAVAVVPGAISKAVGISVKIASGAALHLQSQYKANAYLDQMNRELFMPRGLYAMVMRYKPAPAGSQQQQQQQQEVQLGVEELHLETTKNIAQWTASNTASSSSSSSAAAATKLMRSVRVAAGTTQGDDAMPVRCAQLIFPTKTAAAATDGHPEDGRPGCSSSGASTGNARQVQDKIKSARKFASDYYDRRAQAEYLAQNPDSTLGRQTATPQFRSQYADPTKSTNSSLLGLLTGGRVDGLPRHERRQARRQRRQEARRAQRRDRPRGPVGCTVRGARRVLKEDVLYLMVVNMPSAEELAEAQDLLHEPSPGGR